MALAHAALRRAAGCSGAGRPAGCSASADRGPGPRSWTDSALRHHVSRRGFVTQASGDQALNVSAVTRLDEPAEPSAVSDRGVWESTQPGTPARTWSRRSLGRAWRGASVLQGGGMRAAGPSGTPVWGRRALSRAEAPGPVRRGGVLGPRGRPRLCPRSVSPRSWAACGAEGGDFSLFSSDRGAGPMAAGPS